MDTSEWIQVLALGATAGAMGQAARTVVGLKKLSDEANETQQSLKDLIVASRLTISLIIGAVAGGLTAITLDWSANVTGEQILGLVAAGYAGADFIEGFMGRYLPSGDSGGVNQPAVAPAVPQSTQTTTATTADDGSLG